MNKHKYVNNDYLFRQAKILQGRITKHLLRKYGKAKVTCFGENIYKPCVIEFLEEGGAIIDSKKFSAINKELFNKGISIYDKISK